MKKYLFQTERLGIRNWEDSDIPPFSKMGKDKAVMEFFPSLLTEEASTNFIRRMQIQFTKKGYAYLAVDILESGEFIGMIGIMDQNYNKDLGDFIDIGWRLKQSAWGKGYATEGAKGWLDFAFKELDIKQIYSVASLLNVNSENVMKKLNLNKIGEFDHPKIPQEHLKRCCLYKIQNPNHR